MSSKGLAPPTPCPICGERIPAGEDCPRCVTATASGEPTFETFSVPTRTEIESAPSARPDAGPTRIAHFRIERELGSGGMGTVYHAHDEHMERDVALKVMGRHLLSETSGRRFEQEAWIAGRLDHPNLVKVYERGTWNDLSFFSMELVPGGSLGDVLKRMRAWGKDEARGLEFGSSAYVHWAIRIVIEAARGLDFAHRHGIVHRDVKPMNLLLHDQLGIVKIADFGLAVDVEATRMTQTGAVMGTVSFMAPEQIRGEKDRIDGRTDVYALGVTLFELLTLELPYTGKTMQLYQSQVLTTEARRASKLNARVSRDLDIVLRKAMEKNPNDRYATAGALADDLDNVLHMRPIVAQPAGPWRRTVKWARRKPVHAALAVTLLFSVPVLAAVGVREVYERAAAREARIASLLDEARWLEGRQEYGAMLDRASAVLDLAPAEPMALRHRAVATFFSANTAGASAAESLHENALADVDRVIDLRPDVSWPHALRAYMLTEMGRTEEAAAALERGARLRSTVPSDEDVTEEARLAYARGEPERALELYSELIRRHPDSVRPISARALIHEELGDAQNTGDGTVIAGLDREGHREAAFIDYRVAVGLDPGYAAAWIDLARMSFESGSLDDAKAYLDEALAREPENPFAHEALGKLLETEAVEATFRAETDEAARLYDEAIRASRHALALWDGRKKTGANLRAEMVWGELNLANSLTGRAKLTGKVEPSAMAEPIEIYTKVLSRFHTAPKGGQEWRVYIAALNNLCDAQIGLRRLDEAVATCRKVAEKQPDTAAAFYNLAAAHTLLGETDEALAALEHDMELGDTDWAYLEADPWFASLRGNARFEAIVVEMKRRAS